jgi:MFS family permease
MLLNEHERPAGIHYRILALTWAGWLFDFYDLILYTFLLRPISAELGIGRDAHAVLLGASLGTTAAGGALFGYLGDRFGRKAVLQWSILTYSAGTVLCGLAPGVATLLVARVVTGLGVGGEWAIGHALLAETVPARLRGRFGALLQTGAPAGVGLAAIVGSFVAPHLGWRTTFVLSGLPALLVTAIRRTLPESDLWQRQGGGAPLRPADLLAPGLRRLVAVAFGLAVLNMSSYWFTYTWLPTYLTEERGLTIASSGLKVLVVVCGELLGYASFGVVSDRLGRKPAFSLYAMLMAAGLVSITLLWPLIARWPPLLLLCLWVVGFGTGTWSNFGPMFAELFPTRLRTTAVGTVFNAARGVQLVTPLVVVGVARSHGLAGGIAIAAGFAAGAAAWVWLLPETRGRRLEEA